jgi:hypothetical protein
MNAIWEMTTFFGPQTNVTLVKINIIGPTLAQRIFTNSYYDAVGPTLAQRNSTNSYSDVVSPALA